MTQINIKDNKTAEYHEINKGDFFVFEGVLHCKISDGMAFCTKDAFTHSFDIDVRVQLVKRIDVTLA